MIETPRLVLSRIQAHDLDDIARLYSDPEVVRFIGNGAPADRAESRAWLERALAHWQEHAFGTYSIRLRGGGDFVGRAGLVVQRVEEQREIEIGYALCRSHWHQGYATEAAAAVLDTAARDLGLRRFVALVAPGNRASARVALTLGMTRERDVRFGSRWQELSQMTDLYVLEIQ